MELVTLDPVTYRIDNLIENQNSCMWTDRLVEPGDFEYRTYEIAYGMANLPANKLVSLQDSAEVGIVEDHVIERDDNGVPELKVTGRTFDSFLDERVLVGDRTLAGDPDPPAAGEKAEEPKDESKWVMLQQYTGAQAAGVLIWNTIVDNEPVVTGVSRTGKRIYHGNPLDLLDNVAVSLSGVFVDDPQTWHMELGVLGERARGILEDMDLGIRTIRPYFGSYPRTGRILSAAPGGTAQLTTVNEVTDLRFDIFRGANRTVAANPNVAVIFDFSTGDLDSPNLLFSRKGYKNITIVDSLAWGGVEVGAYTGALNTKGLARRVGYGAADTEQGKRSDGTYLKALQQEGRRRLKAQRPATVVDGEVSPFSNYVYKQDYFMGDYVTMKGDYGINQTVRVTEFIRTEDKENGEVGYPTLTALE